ncbi:MAG TPA: nicotinamide riboside transporter PnuC [Galbitalea sp.]|jgi:nicotinamide mononucleotide transporter
MEAVIAILSYPLFRLLGEQVTVLEAFAFVTGALCVWAVSKQWLWNWPVGLLNNIAFFVLFITSGLYADSGLQVAFFLLGVYGWIAWLRRRRGGAPIATTIPVRHVRPIELLVALAAIAVGTVVIAFLLNTETDSVVPWPDAFIASASLVATWGQARKLFEQWWAWIVVDLVSIPLYLTKGLTLTAILYVGFLALCVYGLVSWHRELVTTPHEVVA